MYCVADDQQSFKSMGYRKVSRCCCFLWTCLAILAVGIRE